MKQSDAQVIIVGGGPVGATFACALASAHIKSLIVDQIDIKNLKTPQADGRAIAINSASRNLFKTLNIWQNIPRNSIQKINTIKTLNGQDQRGLLFQDMENTGQGLGCIVEIPVLRSAILKKTKDFMRTGLIQWIGNTKVKAIQLQDAHATVTTESNQTFSAPCVVGADGKNSVTRQLAGIHAKTKSYHQTAIVRAFEHSNSHENIAYEIFLPNGPFAILPMTKNRSSIVWSLDEEIAQALLSGSETDLDNKIVSMMKPYLSNLKRTGKIWTYPLTLSYVEKYFTNRFALIGDAAHAIHPLAGQGVNLGLKDAAILAEIISDSLDLGIDHGMESTLKTYHDWRKNEVRRLLITTNSLNQLFSNTSKTLNFIRGHGLKLVNKLPLLKNSLENQARGLSGKLPKLINGESLK